MFRSRYQIVSVEGPVEEMPCSDLSKKFYMGMGQPKTRPNDYQRVMSEQFLVLVNVREPIFSKPTKTYRSRVQ